MTDYGHDLRFGTFLTPDADHADQVVALARLTEQVGLELVTVQDHPYQARFLDTWTLLSVIAARTETLRVAPNVANLPLRQPVVLGRSAASLDILSGGRVELGLGAGGFAEAITSIGGPTLSAAERVTGLAEAIEIIRGIWAPEGGRVRVDGSRYRVPGARSGPAPAHDIGIWLGAYKPRMLRMTGRLADGWLPSSAYAAPEALSAMNATIDEAAVAAGRAPEEITRLYNLMGSFGRDDGTFLHGPASVWAEQLAELTLTEGMSTYILASDSPEDIRRFAAEVVPAVRELVAAERGLRRAASDERQAGGAAHDAGGGPGPHRGDAAAGDAPSGDERERTTAPVRVASTSFAVTPTPDDGVRYSDHAAWDESTRPSGPDPDPDRRYTAHEQAAGRHLVDVHDHLRQELAQVRDLVEQVAAGTLDAGSARSHINTMTMRQNNWTLGVYCETYCRVVTTHHTIEDVSLFPHLRKADPRLAPVLDRLKEEHHVIHEVLEGLDRALVAFVADPTNGMKGLRAGVDLLTDTLLSHLSYEERELVEPLARLGFT
ncbi:alkanesulfonate monooxygenase SsuD/methylene tetrahydromethanopterin reductase-like flavin-dependent oxidoreductase (luciferase family) [Actinoalloteichus hoggarensis]|uniref:F420-dependent glucose-6-phosphate dehydrogenase n=1 Tax=Actinoalloteichus hoggarensis TaxID=1470176 RepID=A0A221VWB0_9PSEU|nr:LLM class flavin-dependent oxidoreductase [Actinoalloteichus hoggarensis]ASO17839.1 F420-dependent glucose-6-phosphate dehydrogenase [Actinoalloteichus hoggarensis]MBB5924251.1 alkanesulfonate monooxygenase SsuD/methylene tetrahydromethanopterin reductase-like flavin-dependent oxidoreductase (luciferase family) [Actinoalloteichus hoggarensis]